MSKDKEKKKVIAIEQKSEAKLDTGLKWISSGDLRLVPLELFEANKELNPDLFFQMAHIVLETPQKLVVAVYGLNEVRKIKAMFLCAYDIMDQNIYVRDLFGYLNSENIEDDLIRELEEIKKSYRAKKVKLIRYLDIGKGE